MNDLDRFKWYRVNTVAPHVCCECGETIPADSVTWYGNGKGHRCVTCKPNSPDALRFGRWEQCVPKVRA